eukprot:64192-Prorocentrum_minimum.AAC.1
MCAADSTNLKQTRRLVLIRTHRKPELQHLHHPLGPLRAAAAAIVAEELATLRAQLEADRVRQLQDGLLAVAAGHRHRRPHPLRVGPLRARIGRRRPPGARQLRSPVPQDLVSGPAAGPPRPPPSSFGSLLGQLVVVHPLVHPLPPASSATLRSALQKRHVAPHLRRPCHGPVHAQLARRGLLPVPQLSGAAARRRRLRHHEPASGGRAPPPPARAALAPLAPDHSVARAPRPVAFARGVH